MPPNSETGREKKTTPGSCRKGLRNEAKPSKPNANPPPQADRASSPVHRPFTGLPSYLDQPF